MGESELDGLREWVARVQETGNQRHEATVSKIAILQNRADKQEEISRENGEKLDRILDILSKGKGVVLVFKILFWLAGGISAVIGLWQLLKTNGHQ